MTASPPPEPSPPRRHRIAPTRRLCLLIAAVGSLLLFSPLATTQPTLAGATRSLAALLNLGLLFAFLSDYRRAGGAARSLIVRRHLEERLSLGVVNDVVLKITNPTGATVCVKIQDDPPPSFSCEGERVELTLAPAAQQSHRYQVFPHRRGDERFCDVQLEITGPLGLARRLVAVSADQAVRVYPNIKGVQQWQLLSRRRHLNEIGVHRVRKRGEGSEFDQLRAYNRDDDLRQINWKATARRNIPITTVYETERSQSVIVLLDTGRRMAPWVGGLSKLDYAINASLLLAYVASGGDDNIALGCFDTDLYSWLAPRKGRAQYRRFMEQLYASEARLTHTNYRASFMSLARRMTKRSLVVIFTDALDPDSARDLDASVGLLRPRHLPVIVSLRDPSLKAIAERDPGSEMDIYETVVAQEVYVEHRRMTRDIRRQGVHIVDASPENFSMSIVNEYLRLKARREL